MKRTLILLLAVLLTGGMITSCKKSGCTDPLAGNFESEAEKDDGSCCYNRDVLNYAAIAVFNEFATSTQVARFEFKQYTIESCYAADRTETRLYITNVATDTVSFTFNVECQVDPFTTLWSIQGGSVNLLAPQDTLYYGVVSTNATSIEGKTFSFTGIWSVTYH